MTDWDRNLMEDLKQTLHKFAMTGNYVLLDEIWERAHRFAGNPRTSPVSIKGGNIKLIARTALNLALQEPLTGPKETKSANHFASLNGSIDEILKQASAPDSDDQNIDYIFIRKHRKPAFLDDESGDSLTPEVYPPRRELKAPRVLILKEGAEANGVIAAAQMLRLIQMIPNNKIPTEIVDEWSKYLQSQDYVKKNITEKRVILDRLTGMLFDICFPLFAWVEPYLFNNMTAEQEWYAQMHKETYKWLWGIKEPPKDDLQELQKIHDKVDEVFKGNKYGMLYILNPFVRSLKDKGLGTFANKARDYIKMQHKDPTLSFDKDLMPMYDPFFKSKAGSVTSQTTLFTKVAKLLSTWSTGPIAKMMCDSVGLTEASNAIFECDAYVIDPLINEILEKFKAFIAGDKELLHRPSSTRSLFLVQAYALLRQGSPDQAAVVDYFLLCIVCQICNLQREQTLGEKTRAARQILFNTLGTVNSTAIVFIILCYGILNKNNVPGYKWEALVYEQESNK